MSEEDSPRGSQIDEIELVTEDYNHKSVFAYNSSNVVNSPEEKTPDVSPKTNQQSQLNVPMLSHLVCPKDHRRRSKTFKNLQCQRPENAIEIHSA